GDQDELLELLAPTADYDPIRAQACLLIEANMVKAGINLKCNHQSFGTIISKIDAREFQMYILGWAIGGTDPDYLYSFFYSLNANRGQNYPGYQSTEFDQVILNSRTEMDPAKRQELIRWAQGILVTDLPYNVLYYRKNIEAYRLDRFTGWTTTARGSIFNYWSIMNIRPPTNKFLRTSVTLASAVSSNKTEDVTVTVRDQDKNIVQGAEVTVTVEMGNLTFGGTNYGDSWTGQTNINGQIIVKFEAPYIPPTEENGTRVGITVQATKTEYDDSGLKTVFILVFPTGVQFLSVTIELKFGDLIDEGTSTEADVKVKDENLQLVDGVTVKLTATPTDLTISPTNGTTANGGLIEGVVLTAPNVDADTKYIIKAAPSKAGTKGVNGTVDLWVLNSPVIPPPPVPGFDILTVIAVISIASISYGIFATRKKRS
ncbi:MAG: hypothetical protein KAI64_04385, partial [Thermoplasmata archaeon]|nr:hypothetical protein [Thermoplasmata archaeon]